MSDKATKEILNLIISVADAVKSARSDGKIDIFDLPKLAPVLPQLRAVVADAGIVMDELRNLSSDETTELLSMAVDAIMKIVDAIFTAAPNA